MAFSVAQQGTDTINHKPTAPQVFTHITAFDVLQHTICHRVNQRVNYTRINSIKNDQNDEGNNKVTQHASITANKT